MTQTPTIGIVLPCYNEEEILLETDKKIGALVDHLINKKLIAAASSIIYIDDGSKDKTWELIQNRVDASSNRVGIKFSRNFGHQSALLGGITSIYQQVDCIITIDADLQDDIGVIEDMIVKYTQGFEVVYGVRKKREIDSAFKRRTAEGFYLLMRRMGVNIIYNHADFRLASNRVCENLLRFGEVNLFLRGIFPLIGFNSTTVYYDRLERNAGHTKYPLIKMLGFALEGITSFSVKPLRIVSLIGIFIFFGSVLLSLYSLYSYFFRGTVPGWTSVILPIYFLGGVQILCIGIIGEYLGKIYKEVKSRPRFIIETMISSNN
ncbi:MAG TPA: glycosyltransferase family 2 protein [Chitinophagaceae bacterium]|jgi:polyisoprenyl-phosphate glycosyltransferase|nr:glycosyltransferase family 2 protein [Chitinophagaceae bacterium]